MSEELKEWAFMWGAKVKLRNDMPDDMLKDAIETSRRIISNVTDFEVEGTAKITHHSHLLSLHYKLMLFLPPRSCMC